jgi:hypothetical protein
MYKTHNDGIVQREFHYNQGKIITTYHTLVTLFSEPMTGYEKSDACWNIKFADDVESSIYNWNPNKYPKNLDDIKEWTVGGYTYASYKNVKNILSFDMNDLKEVLEEDVEFEETTFDQEVSVY